MQRLPLLLFAAVCFIYFLLCRRLSLVFEWAFLAGFAGALPICWMSRRFNRRGWHLQIARSLACVMAFGLFYGTGVLLLVVKVAR